MRCLMMLAATAVVASVLTNTTLAADTNQVMKIRVTGDRVSLRPAPKLEGAPLDRAMSGEELIYLEMTNGWVGVQAPASLEVWVAREFVEDGVVQPEKLNVRAGPSLSYSRLAVLNKGDRVDVRGEFENWLRIAPPRECLVWISADYVEFIEPSAPDPVVEAVIEPEVVQQTEPEPEPKPEPEPEPEMVAEYQPPTATKLVLDSSREQGVYVKIPGVLRRATPGLYQLVLVEGELEEPICLVRGKESQMEELLHRFLLIEGKRYWVKDVDIPVVQPEKIVLDPIIAE